MSNMALCRWKAVQQTSNNKAMPTMIIYLSLVIGMCRGGRVRHTYKETKLALTFVPLQLCGRRMNREHKNEEGSRKRRSIEKFPMGCGRWRIEGFPLSCHNNRLHFCIWYLQHIKGFNTLLDSLTLKKPTFAINIDQCKRIGVALVAMTMRSEMLFFFVFFFSFGVNYEESSHNSPKKKSHPKRATVMLKCIPFEIVHFGFRSVYEARQFQKQVNHFKRNIL